MYKILRADKDSYITNRVVNGISMLNSNVGNASSLDLYKLHGYSSSGSSPNTELTRLLVHFDLESLRDLVSTNAIDITNQTFNAALVLSDVYGGQTTPSNFLVNVHPLSASFDEGIGQDVCFYSDVDVCNFLTGSRLAGQWIGTGCSYSGTVPSTCDYFSDSLFTSTQLFKKGTEDLSTDVTLAISATLAGLLPDEGFRISYSNAIESDSRTYFVKRFASRTAHDESKHPKLIIRYDDSIQDDCQTAQVDSPVTLFMYNYVNNKEANLMSASIPVTGTNCLQLRLEMPISGGIINIAFSGSQHNAQTGIYSSSFIVPTSNSQIAHELATSGSLKFTPIWSSFDETVTYSTGSVITVNSRQGTSRKTGAKKLSITMLNVRQEYNSNEIVLLRMNIFDYTSPTLTAVRVPVEAKSIVIRDVHYQVRDVESNEVRIPFDSVYNSTRLSNDSDGMFFQLDMSNLVAMHLYTIDALVIDAGSRQIYENVGPAFRVTST